VDVWRELARDLPVIGAPDVLVVGAGIAGIAAAIAAARRGADVWLVERYGFIGGLATFGLINLLLTLDDGCGTQVVAGLCQEFVDRLDGRHPAPAEWGSTDPAAVEHWRQWGLIWGAPPDVVRYSVAFDPEDFCHVSFDLLRAAGVPFEKRVGRMMEGLRLMRALWSGKPVDWDGRWKVEGAVLGPTPHRPSIGVSAG
jgi:hypothetical protein